MNGLNSRMETTKKIIIELENREREIYVIREEGKRERKRERTLKSIKELQKLVGAISKALSC
jgi:hypothetical protein